MNSEALSTTVRYLKVMARATRLRILGILADGERRELIAAGLTQRDGGIYWRVD